MLETTSIARPYAKALFEHARDTNALSLWSSVLSTLAMIAQNDDARAFINNPAVSVAQQAQLFSSVLISSPYAQKTYASIQMLIENMLRLLTKNKRLLVLPDIADQYDAMRATHEKTLVIQVRSYTSLTPEQEARLTTSLGHRLHRRVTLSIEVDKTLLGGMIISADDWVIDGSVKGQLRKLATQLAA